MKYKSRFSGEGKFATWMYHIAHNVYTDHFKKNAKANVNCTSNAETEDCKTAEHYS
ncbi:MAG: hypothetical protein JXM79_14015 [Sedimentisphaerales bacterium]|nr:hypothetical protein [Sedimentisphaerales bacterium]